jgi:hypothetical protein
MSGLMKMMGGPGAGMPAFDDLARGPAGGTRPPGSAKKPKKYRRF